MHSPDAVLAFLAVGATMDAISMFAGPTHLLVEGMRSGKSRWLLFMALLARVSPEMAVRLSKVFGGSAPTWLVQQAQYDLAHVRADRIRLKRLEFA
ncbi:MAG: hypothetical protein WDO73_02030 [Ignavibacteriota bacterium]